MNATPPIPPIPLTFPVLPAPGSWLAGVREMMICAQGQGRDWKLDQMQ
ncbi:hypothetical protein [Poriferisphaera corsica]|nr:hypothetical protein [Poriferisphaera corsica]